MMSPLDLKNKKIEPRKRKYYDKDDMDEYLEFVFEEYKKLYDENQELQKNNRSLNEGVQYYRSIETTMQKALVLAEKTAKETKDAAQLKAEAIEKDANAKAEKIVSEAEQQYDKLKDKSLYLVQQFNQYKMQLKQVASAQLELITSDSFDIYSPELESAIQPDNKAIEMPKEEQKEEDFGKTTVLPDVRANRNISNTIQNSENESDILSADTIDLSSSIEKIREVESAQSPKDVVTKEVQDALVLEPVDAVVTEPLELKAEDMKHESSPEVLELEEDEENEAPTLDSLLQSINIGKNNKKKEGQDEDPFEFLGSVDDF